MIFKLILPLLLLTLGLFQTNCLQIAFMPSPGNFEVIPTFVKLAEYLSSSKNYDCVAIVHGADKDAWNKTCTQLKYGSDQGEEYLVELYSAQNVLEEKYWFSAEPFRRSYEMIIKAFYESKVLAELKGFEIELLVCDSSNILCNLVAEKLNIQKKVSHSPTVPNPYWNDAFDFSASSHPVMSSPYTNLMGIWQRLMNYKNHLFISLSIKSQRKLFKQLLKEKEDEKLKLDNLFDPFSLFTTQVVRGFNYPIPLPPNIANLGCMSCIRPHQVSVTLDKTLSKYTQNVYIKLDTINNPDILKSLIDTVEELKKVGFIIRADIPKGLKFPVNLHRIDYIPTVDILSNSKVNAFVHDGDWTSIVEGIYYKKPMIAISYRYDRRANGALVEDRGVGIVIDKEKDLTKKKLADSIKSVLDPKEKYLEAITKYSKIAVSIDTPHQIEKWFEIYIQKGIDHLVVKPYYEMSYFAYHNLDVWFVVIGIPMIIIIALYFALRKLLRKCKKALKGQIFSREKRDIIRENKDFQKEKVE